MYQVEKEDEFQEEIDIHNKVCLKSPIHKDKWLGCPYSINKNYKFQPQLLECNLCGVQILQVIELENDKPVNKKYHWGGWLSRNVKL